MKHHIVSRFVKMKNGDIATCAVRSFETYEEADRCARMLTEREAMFAGARLVHVSGKEAVDLEHTLTEYIFRWMLVEDMGYAVSEVEHGENLIVLPKATRGS